MKFTLAKINKQKRIKLRKKNNQLYLMKKKKKFHKLQIHKISMTMKQELTFLGNYNNRDREDNRESNKEKILSLILLAIFMIKTIFFGRIVEKWNLKYNYHFKGTNKEIV